jgi:NAD(P)-dependent dehydrogenase (short-subunit alcohol dehydrogenase family)
MPNTVIVLTGATDGHGRALARELSQLQDTTLLLHGRNPERLDRLRTELAGCPAEIATVEADFMWLARVHALADDIAARTGHVSVLINNAGVAGGAERRLTADGNELCFGVNHLASFALTRRLLPLLREGAPARVVNVGSIGQVPIDFDDLTFSRDYGGLRAYRRSKLAMITTGLILADRLDPAEVTVNSVHPATFMPTKLALEMIGQSRGSLEDGVRATLRMVVDPALCGVTGRFYVGTEESRAYPTAYQPQVREQLWAVSERLTEPLSRPPE